MLLSCPTHFSRKLKLAARRHHWLLRRRTAGRILCQASAPFAFAAPRTANGCLLHAHTAPLPPSPHTFTMATSFKLYVAEGIAAVASLRSSVCSLDAHAKPVDRASPPTGRAHPLLRQRCGAGAPRAAAAPLPRGEGRLSKRRVASRAGLVRLHAQERNEATVAIPSAT